MRATLKVDLVLLVLAGASLCRAADVPSVEAEVVARAYVPNTVIPQGEVRLVRQGHATIVQSVLHTRFEKRVAHRIADSEQKNWGRHPDAVAYVESMEEAFAEYSKRSAGKSKDRALVISFIDDPKTVRVEFSFPAFSKDGQGFHIQPATVWKSLVLSEDYIRNNQEYILVDAFKKRSADLLHRLRDYRTPGGTAHHD